VAARPYRFGEMRNLYWITTSQAATIALFQVMNRYAGNLPPISCALSRYTRRRCPSS